MKVFNDTWESEEALRRGELEIGDIVTDEVNGLMQVVGMSSEQGEPVWCAGQGGKRIEIIRGGVGITYQVLGYKAVLCECGRLHDKAPDSCECGMVFVTEEDELAEAMDDDEYWDDDGEDCDYDDDDSEDGEIEIEDHDLGDDDLEEEFAQAPAVKQLPAFVYGTLRKGFGNYNRILSGRTVRELPGVLLGAAMYDVANGGFPGIVPDAEELVHGELMWIDGTVYDQVMRSLDSLEGYREGNENSMYIRSTVLVHIAGAEAPVEAWTYIWNGGVDRYTKVSGGDWKHYKHDFVDMRWGAR
jgi:gamma-glutamylcyclotransferase (GGCT)/AIG2-like uncharacterized protein YtfP